MLKIAAIVAVIVTISAEIAAACGGYGAQPRVVECVTTTDALDMGETRRGSGMTRVFASGGVSSLDNYRTDRYGFFLEVAKWNLDWAKTRAAELAKFDPNRQPIFTFLRYSDSAQTWALHVGRFMHPNCPAKR